MAQTQRELSAQEKRLLGLATRRIPIKTQLVRSETAMYVWKDGMWNEKLRRIMVATSDYETADEHDYSPNVLLVAHIEEDDSLCDFIQRRRHSIDWILMTRKWLNTYPTFVADLKLERVSFIEDLTEMYEHVPAVAGVSIEEQALVVATLFNRRRLIGVVPAQTQLCTFYETHVGRIEQISLTTLVPDIVLIQQYFQHPAPARHAEFMHCFEQNIQYPYVDKIIMLVESHTHFVPPHPKVQVYNIGRRLTYGTAMRWATDNLPHGTIVILANLDIYFDHTIGFVYDLDMRDTCLALLRYDVSRSTGQMKLFGPRADSQDAWVFKLPLPATTKLHEPGWEIELGRPGCDNCIAYELVQHRIRVANPALTIRALHIHETGVRDYTVQNLVLRPVYIHVEPSQLHDYVDSTKTESICGFSAPDGSVFDYKHKYAGTPLRGVYRTLTTDEFISLQVNSASEWKNPYAFLLSVLPRILTATKKWPTAECRFPDSPALFSTLLSYLKWPTERMKIVPYHPKMLVWSPKIHYVETTGSLPTSDDITSLLTALEPLFVTNDSHIRSSELRHVVCACSPETIQYLRDNGKQMNMAWNGIHVIDAEGETIEHLRLVRSTSMVIVDSNNTAANCILFAKPGTHVIEVGAAAETRPIKHLCNLLSLTYTHVDSQDSLVSCVVSA